MHENKDVRNFWRVVAVVSLSVAGLCCAFLAWVADTLLSTVMLGVAAFFLLISAVYEAATGRLPHLDEGSEKGSEETELISENLPSPRDVLRRGSSIMGEGFRKLGKEIISFFRDLRSLFTEVGSAKRGSSARQKEIWYEDILSQSVSRVKKSLRERNLDLEAVLEAEKRRRNREELVQWLKELTDGDSDGR